MASDRSLYLSAVRSVVIKLGTQLLSNKDGLDKPYIASIASQVATLRSKGILVSIVSSGAIGAGLKELKIPKRPTDLATLQAVAAVGQRRLMDVWGEAFHPHQLPVAQILLTREDIESRKRFLNVRNTILAIHELGGVPIINENDTISTDELVKITFGDNDILAANVAHALRANLLVLMTVVDGLLDPAGQSVRLVSCIDQARQLVRTEKSALGKGGMDSKLHAAKMVNDAGEAMLVLDGRMPHVLLRALDCEEVGTLFTPACHGKKLPSRARWIGAVRPAGTIVVDEGAAKALIEKNRSLLPAGILHVEGHFERGDVVAIHSPPGHPIARGLTNYPSPTISQIRGKKTAEVRALLQESAYDEVIHRDNLVIE